MTLASLYYLLWFKINLKVIWGWETSLLSKTSFMEAASSPEKIPTR